MRVHELTAQHSVQWPPLVVSTVRRGEKLPLASEVRQAVLESVFWSEDAVRPWIDLQLQLPGRMVTASLVCRTGERKIYQDLFWALQRGLGRTLAEIENLQVVP